MSAPLSPATPAPISTSHSLRQLEQLRRFLYPSLSSTDNLPLLLPLSQIQQKDAAWINLDLDCQLLLAQVLRVAIQPWYSKLTNDRQLYEEVVRVTIYGLHRVKDALLRRSGNATRLERFLLYDVTTSVQLHYIELRRAVAMTAYNKEQEAAASIFLASNPHPALSLTTHSQLLIDEDYLDLLLLAILQGTLPPDHLESHNETLIIIDVVKGIFRGQTRVHGSGVWVVVRALLALLEMQAPDPTMNATTRWDHRANLILGLNLVYAVFQTLFLYLAVFYLDLFTPLAEPKKRTRRRKGAELETTNEWNLEAVLDVIVEALQWRGRIMTCFLEEWIRIGLAWGGTRLIERQAKKILAQWTQPERMRGYIAKLHEAIVDAPHQSPLEPAQEPSLDVQRKELDLFITKVLFQVRSYPPVALLLGHDESMQRQSIEAALSPFLSPPLDPDRTSVTQIANTRTLISLLECFARLVNPALEE